MPERVKQKKQRRGDKCIRTEEKKYSVLIKTHKFRWRRQQKRQNDFGLARWALKINKTINQGQHEEEERIKMEVSFSFSTQQQKYHIYNYRLFWE